MIDNRSDLAIPGAAKRIVIKIGSSSLTGPGGALDPAVLQRFVATVAARAHSGSEMVVVSSGAIAAAVGQLGLQGRPADLATAQAAASVGQGLLIAEYTQAFAAAGFTVGQVLLTETDVVRRSHYRNAQRALDRLIDLGVVPIINENDAVATDEIRFGDNDRLAAFVSHVMRADVLILLTDIDGLYNGHPRDPLSERISTVNDFSEISDVKITAPGSRVGTGGMVTKVEAAAMATRAGIPVVLARADQLEDVLAGQDRGTWFAAGAKRIRSRRLWLAHAAHVRGRLILDQGAVRAITQGRKSLLAAGIVRVEGSFAAGEAVELATSDGDVIGRGVSTYSARDLPARLGKSSEQLRIEFGGAQARVVVHRDDLVLM